MSYSEILGIDFSRARSSQMKSSGFVQRQQITITALNAAYHLSEAKNLVV
jgi:hypothetical protein